MAYIRNREEERTGYEVSAYPNDFIDLGLDFSIVYGTDKSMPERMKLFQERGYVTQLMVGISWGSYQDYVDGEWDGVNHWDEAQHDRNGDPVMHVCGIPYMVPTINYTDYLIEKCKVAVDAGAVAIQAVEPEFWVQSGYSPAFRREYELYYREQWKAPHEDADTAYKAAKLKNYLYVRALDRVASAVKEYAKVKYNRNLRFCVPCHSITSYSQLGIVSPEAALIDTPTMDGYIAQVWTDTGRVPNVYDGIFKERSFESTYLEYGVMQELARGTGRRMWFLDDAVQDNPTWTWDIYRYNYTRVLTASLLHPFVSHYEVSPWPNRIFEGKFPKKRIGNEWKFMETEESVGIPSSYSSFLANMFQMLGDMEQPEYAFEGVESGVGVFTSDSCMFQRSYPDGIIKNNRLNPLMAGILTHTKDAVIDREASAAVMKEIDEDPSLMYEFIISGSLPQFFGLAMPLLKYGLSVRPVQLDNVRRYTDYLNDSRLLVLSYEFIKPDSPQINTAIVSWVRKGGTLCYVGDGSDPYHNIDAWWTRDGYRTPAGHLFEEAGLDRAPADGTYRVGNGRIVVWNMLPARICLDGAYSSQLRAMVKNALAEMDIDWQYRNDLTLHRGPYVISAVMDESVNEEHKVFEGLFADMQESDFRIITRKEIGPNENALLFDFDKISGEDFRIIGTGARIFSADRTDDGVTLRMKAAKNIRTHVRLRLPEEPSCVSAVSDGGEEVPVEWEWDGASRTVMFVYDSAAQMLTVNIAYKA